MTPAITAHERASKALEQAAAAHLVRSATRLRTLREVWLRSHQPMDDVLLHGVAEVEYRLQATSQSLAMVQGFGGEDFEDLRQALSPALDDVDARIERLRRATAVPLAALAESAAGTP